MSLEIGLVNKMMKNLYIVSSPFQCISAIEARTQLELNNDNILITIYYSKDSEENYLQMREIFGLLEWDNIIEIGLEKRKSKFFEYISVINKLKKYKFNNVFIGHFSQFQTILLSNLLINNIYSIDDGVITLKLHKDQLNPYIKKKNNFAKKIKMLRYSLVSLKTSFDKSKINYFTMFDIEPYYGEKIIKNEFIFMREYSSKKTQNNSLAYFLGQPLYEVGIMQKNDYLRCLKSVKQYYKNQNIMIMYIPHRREKDINSLKILEDDYFEVRKLPTAIEVYFLKLNCLPKEVSSFLSTALLSIQNIFKIETNAFYITKDLLLKKHLSIEELYDEFKNNGVKILELENM